MTELATMAANKISSNTNNAPNSPVLSTTSSLVSPDSSATNPISLISSPDVSLAGVSLAHTSQNTPQNSTPHTPIAVDNIQETTFSIATTSNNGDGFTNEITTKMVTVISSSSIKSNDDEILKTNVTTSDSTMTLTAVDSIQQSSSQETIDLDVKIGSVLEKAKTFEQLEKKQQLQAQIIHHVPTRSQHNSGENIYGSSGNSNSSCNLIVSNVNSNTNSKKDEIYKSTSALEKDSTGKSFLFCSF